MANGYGLVWIIRIGKRSILRRFGMLLIGRRRRSALVNSRWVSQETYGERVYE